MFYLIDFNSFLFLFESGDEEAFDKFARRTVKVTREHAEECKRLLKCMGIPYVDAPTEAEARKYDCFNFDTDLSYYLLFRMCSTCQRRKSLWNWY